MLPDDRNAAYLWDMYEASRWIVSFMQGVNFTQYRTDKKLQSAVERQLEILGEAANHISEGFQKEHPKIPWRQIIGLRNLIVHEYGDVKIERIWKIASVNIVELMNIIEILIPPIED